MTGSAKFHAWKVDFTFNFSNFFDYIVLTGFDIVNFLFIFLILYVLFLKRVIAREHFILFSLISLVPMLLNNVLFPPSYLGDQHKYLYVTQSFRHLVFDVNIKDVSTTVFFSSIFMSLVPVPFIETINSIGFVNKFIYLGLIIFCIHRKYVTNNIVIFLCLYPSALLYSSLSLRDTIVLVTMFLVVFSYLRRHRMIALLALYYLFLIKPQNALIIIVFLCIFSFLTKGRFFNRYKVFFLIPVGIIAAALPLLIEEIDYFRLAFFVEDGGIPTDYVPIESFSGLVSELLFGWAKFLVRPLPFQAQNIFQLIQSFENLLILALIIYYCAQMSQYNKMIVFKWLTFLVISLAVYSLVIFNFGTAARYKFPFIVLFFIFLSYEIRQFIAQRGYKS